MSLVLLDSSNLDKEKWGKLLHLASFSTFYHTSAWCNLWEASLKSCGATYFVEKQGSDYVAALPVVRITKNGLQSFFSMPMGTYGGPVYSDAAGSHVEEFLRQVLSLVKHRRCLRIQIVDFEGRSSFLEQSGFASRPAFTHVMDLNRVDLVQILHKRGFLQSQKKGVSARKIQTAKDVQICFQIYLETCQRHQTRPKYPFQFYQNMLDAGKQSEWLCWWVAEIDRTIIGYQINFVFKDCLYLWDAGSHTESLGFRPNDSLMGQSLKWCQENQINFYNLGGSPPQAEGLVHFKEQWGAQNKQYLIYEKKFFLGKLLDLVRRK